MIALTSLAPGAERVLAQRERLASWRAAGLQPVSVNHHDEIPWLQGAYHGVEFSATHMTAEKTFGRPYVRINALLEEVSRRGEPCLFINADLTCSALAGLLPLLAERSTTVLPYLLQWNHTAAGTYVVEPCGISAFVVHPRLASICAESTLCLGQPWWDYWLPFAALLAGETFVTPEQPVLVHEYHSSRWSEDNWLTCATEFARLCGGRVEDHESASRLSAMVHAAIQAKTVQL